MSWPACLSCVCSYGICTILTGEICEMLRIYKWEGSGYNTIKMWERFHVRTHKKTWKTSKEMTEKLINTKALGKTDILKIEINMESIS